MGLEKGYRKPRAKHLLRGMHSGLGIQKAIVRLKDWEKMTRLTPDILGQGENNGLCCQGRCEIFLAESARQKGIRHQLIK